jgi:hypothetical protein
MNEQVIRELLRTSREYLGLGKKWAPPAGGGLDRKGDTS